MTIAQGLQTLAADEHQQRVGGLIGQPFSGARTSYGDELRLSFGPGVEPTSRWRLGTRTARWILLGDVGVCHAIPTARRVSARSRPSTTQRSQRSTSRAPTAR